jgi:hypothetical protein
LNGEFGMRNAEKKGMGHRAERMEHSEKITELIEIGMRRAKGSYGAGHKVQDVRFDNDAILISTLNPCMKLDQNGIVSFSIKLAAFFGRRLG